MKPTAPSLRLALPLLAALVLGACGSDPTFPPEFDASLGVDLNAMTKTASGLYYQDLVVGTGETVIPGYDVEVNYTGWLSNGHQFDTGSFDFVVGGGGVIAGFDEGVLGMNVGGKRKLVIRPELGYGNKQQGPIPANSTLVFDVEVTGILTSAH